jgi:hypothetical protein
LSWIRFENPEFDRILIFEIWNRFFFVTDKILLNVPFSNTFSMRFKGSSINDVITLHEQETLTPRYHLLSTSKIAFLTGIKKFLVNLKDWSIWTSIRKWWCYSDTSGFFLLFLLRLLVHITTQIDWLKSNLLLKITCSETHTYMKI